MDKLYAIFDMDGTLVDSMGYWRRLGREYLAGRGITEQVRPVLAKTKSMTTPESAALFQQTFRLPGTAAEIAAEMTSVMEAHYREDVSLKPGVAAYLARLREAGVRMCVASATARPLVELCLQRLHILDCFSFLLSCEEVGAGKDRPGVFLEAARRLGAVPAEIAVFEDALHALETAKAAGFYTVAVYDESGRAEWETMRAVADEALPDWLH